MLTICRSEERTCTQSCMFQREPAPREVPKIVSIGAFPAHRTGGTPLLYSTYMNGVLHVTTAALYLVFAVQRKQILHVTETNSDTGHSRRRSKQGRMLRLAPAPATRSRTSFDRTWTKCPAPLSSPPLISRRRTGALMPQARLRVARGASSRSAAAPSPNNSSSLGFFAAPFGFI